MKHGKIKWGAVICTLLAVTLLTVGFLCFYAARWYLFLYGSLSVNSLLFTLLSGLSGVENSLIFSFLMRAGFLTVLSVAGLTLLFAQRSRFQLRLYVFRKRVVLSPLKPWVFLLLSISLCVLLVCNAMNLIGLPQWLENLRYAGTIFEDEYVETKSVEITFPEQKRNLIYITLESMETTFCSKEQGGEMETCVIPELYQLAMNHTSFSNTDGIGGWNGNLIGADWTTGSLVSQMAGIPLLLPFGGNSSEQMTKVLPGATFLWDILHDEGYYQVLMIGSEREFSGQVKLTAQHGIDKMYDYHTAVEEGFVPEDYFAWWGIEDAKLFDYARQEIDKISQMGQPFNVTISTIDTHMTDGYLCQYCQDQYSEQYENVFACSSRMVQQFIEWAMEQPWYENTTIVLCGDHPTMDFGFIRRVELPEANRRIYNCIINAPIQTDNTRNREILPMDFFPTTLAALGCTIEGDRLAMGTNLYSDVPSLGERLTTMELNTQFYIATVPYIYHFLVE